MIDNPIQLSVVATSRNDNHGKNLLYRMQHFVDGFIEQCKRHDLRAELILVEWNPPDGSKSLAEVLQYPHDKGPCSVRIIQVPQEIHAKLDNADKIPLFQMIAKNVGIRRAKGKFVLATNIDVLFSDPLMTFLKHKLKTGSLYRVDRFDVPEQLPSPSNFEQILKFCSDNYFRINGRTGTINTRKTNTSPFQIIYNKINIILNCTISNLLKKFINTSINDAIKLLKRLIQKVICFCYPKNSIILHTNACGDFTLLSIDDWAKLKGYPEWSIFSWHIDSVLLYQAKQHGIKEIDLPRKMSIYHIEHEIGSGYSAEGAQTLFNRLETRGIPYLSNADLKRLITELNHSKEKVMYNDENWGFANIQLKEFIV